MAFAVHDFEGPFGIGLSLKVNELVAAPFFGLQERGENFETGKRESRGRLRLLEEKEQGVVDLGLLGQVGDQKRRGVLGLRADDDLIQEMLHQKREVVREEISWEVGDQSS